MNAQTMPTQRHLPRRASLLAAVWLVAMAGLAAEPAHALPAIDVRVIDVAAGAAHSHPRALMALGDTLYYSATDGCPSGGVGRELWSVDASGELALVQDINTATSGNCDGYPGDSGVAKLGAKLVFEARNNPFRFDAKGFEPWISDGTGAGTVLLMDIYRGSQPSFPYGFTSVLGGTRVVFGAEQPADGYDPEPWITDGTAGGTLRVADVAPDDYGSFPRHFTPLSDSQFVFVGTNYPADSYSNVGLWVSDGDGAQLIHDFSAGGDGVDAAAQLGGSGLVVMSANDGTGYEPWITDGSAAGTYRLADIRPGAASSSPETFTQVGSQMFFWANDGTHGTELWVSDGTATGTRLVKDIHAGSGGSFGGYAAEFGGRLYFAASDGTSGVELWVSDGTEAGTLPFGDLIGVATGGVPRWLTVVGSRLFFTSGLSMWVTDGTPEGTGEVASGFGNPVDLTAVGSSRLAFVATDPLLGRELHLLELANEPPSIEAIDDITSPEHSLLQVAPAVDDPDGDPFSLTWEGLPTGALTDGDVLSWTPAEGQAPGSYEITVTATQDDNPSLFDSETFTITVLEVNAPPQLAPIGPQSGVAGEPVEFWAGATDPDVPANALTFSLSVLSGDVSEASIDPDTGQVLVVGAAGQHIVRIEVSDGELSDHEDVEMDVTGSGAAADVEVALGGLQNLLVDTPDGKTAKQLAKAIDLLGKSLTPSWWIDADSLSLTDGQKVFGEHRKAVKALAGNELGDDPDARQLLDLILDVDRELARLEIGRAEATGGNPRDIAKAWEAIANGDAERADGSYDKAATGYGKAWQKARDAQR